jgi:hypothetical protein
MRRGDEEERRTIFDCRDLRGLANAKWDFNVRR